MENLIIRFSFLFLKYLLCFFVLELSVYPLCSCFSDLYILCFHKSYYFSVVNNTEIEGKSSPEFFILWDFFEIISKEIFPRNSSVDFHFKSCLS